MVSAAGRVVIDLIAHDAMFAGSTKGPDASPRGFERWTVDPRRRAVDIRTLDRSPQEFPRIDARRSGQPCRFACTVALPEPRRPHEFGENRFPGEFAFIPRSPGAAEDDGWLMGFVVNLPAGRSDLVVLDARGLGGEPVAEVHLPHRVPSGFHGEWHPAGAADPGLPA